MKIYLGYQDSFWDSTGHVDDDVLLEWTGVGRGGFCLDIQGELESAGP